MIENQALDKSLFTEMMRNIRKEGDGQDDEIQPKETEDDGESRALDKSLVTEMMRNVRG